MRILLLSLFCFVSACGGDNPAEADDNKKQGATSAASESAQPAADAKKTAASQPTEVAQAANAGDSVLRFQEGVDYLVRPNKALSPKREFVEFFSYSCPHCYHAEPAVKAYLAQKPDNVEVIKIPTGFFNPRFELTRLGAIVAEVLGKREELHDKMFLAIHGAGGKHFRNDKELLAFFVANGVSEEEYKKALQSEEANKLHFSYRKMVNESGITGVPAFIIRNKYQVAHRHDRSHEEFAALINFLMEKSD